MNEKEIALHESGHCLMFFYTGVPFEWVELGGEIKGRVHSPNTKEYYKQFPVMEMVRMNTMINIGGLAVESLYSGKQGKDIVANGQGGTADDLYQVYELLKLVMTEKDMPIYLNGLYEETFRFVDSNLKIVEAIAKALLSKEPVNGIKRLTYQEVKAIYMAMK